MTAPIRTYRDLLVWQKGMQLSEDIYRLSSRFPRSEIWSMTSQIRAAAISVPANVAEGHEKYSSGVEFARHLGIARGSLAEVETYVLLAVRLGYVDEQDTNPITDLTTELSKMLRSLQRRMATLTTKPG